MEDLATPLLIGSQEGQRSLVLNRIENAFEDVVNAMLSDSVASIDLTLNPIGPEHDSTAGPFVDQPVVAYFPGTDPREAWRFSSLKPLSWLFEATSDLFSL